MKTFIIFLLCMFAVALQADDLRIINPRIYFNTQKEPLKYKKQGNEIIKYKALVSFFILNQGKTVYRLPTHFAGATTVTGDKDTEYNKKYTGSVLSIPNNTTVITLNTTNNMSIVENKDKNIPAASIIYPEAFFKIAELRPGEAVWLDYEISLEIPPNSRKFIFEYISDNMNKRYDFWDGKIVSPTYLCKDINLDINKLLKKLEMNIKL